MTWDEFDAWSELSAQGFAARLADAGLMTPQEAAGYARRQLADLLPEGIATPLHLLWTVREAVPGQPVVGHLWLRVAPAPGVDPVVEAYVFDVELVEAARGRGLGTATMLAAEEAARDLGAGVIRLNVFVQDVPALRMYERLGYVTVAEDTSRDGGATARSMTKDL
jgi:ribosomal protein S18 acetylase RimI-like enzyme